MTVSATVGDPSVQLTLAEWFATDYAVTLGPCKIVYMVQEDEWCDVPLGTLPLSNMVSVSATNVLTVSTTTAVAETTLYVCAFQFDSVKVIPLKVTMTDPVIPVVPVLQP